MSTHIISYDLRKPGRDYTSLTKAIRDLGPTRRPLESLWIVRSDATCPQIHDHLKTHMDQNDRLLVVRSGDHGAWSGVDKEISDWLMTNL